AAGAEPGGRRLVLCGGRQRRRGRAGGARRPGPEPARQPRPRTGDRAVGQLPAGPTTGRAPAAGKHRLGHPGRAFSARGGMMRIYVLDDDPQVLAANAFLLKAMGHESRCWSEPAAFLAELDDAEPAVLLLDLAMPELDGLAVLD